MSSGALLSVNRLTVEFKTRDGIVSAVNDVSFELHKGQVLAIVGESGSGKSVTSYSILGLLGDNGRIAAGSITYGGMSLHKANKQLLQEIRGREISMIFQNPRSTLNPIRSVGDQLSDMLRAHAQASKSTAKEKAIKLLQQVHIADTDRIMQAYPFELSGGLCQRIMIALALACDPKILIADEPTTGLDVTTQKTIMDLIQSLAVERGMSVILITHDLGMAAAYSQRAVVMQKGRVVESASIDEVFNNPQSDYTKKLLAATPRKDSRLADLADAGVAVSDISVDRAVQPLLLVESLEKTYWRGSGKKEVGHQALKKINFEVFPGECVGLVGESGCGKSTTSRIVTRLDEATGGRVLFSGSDITQISAKQFTRSELRRDIQMVFQDPTDSLNPRLSAFDAIAEPIKRLTTLSGSALRARVEQISDQVSFSPSLLGRFPHQLSGGQKARVGIARAIAVSPKLLILDEPTSALDVSVQAVVLQLLHKLRAELNLSYLFISHDLNVVRLLCDRVLVMFEGEIVEDGDAESVMNHPQHPYTQQLVDAIPHLQTA